MTIDPQLLTGLGSAISIFLASAGSAIASSHSGVYAVRGKDLKAFCPIVISGVLAIYGIIVSVLLVGRFDHSITEVEGYRNLSAGLAVGLACCASGLGLASFMKQINDSSSTAPHSNSSPESEPLVGRRTNGSVAHKFHVSLPLPCIFGGNWTLWPHCRLISRGIIRMYASTIFVYTSLIP